MKVSLPVRRPPWAHRFAIAFALASVFCAALAQRASAGEDVVVPRIVSLGGSCVKCDLSNRKLVGARFVAGNFQRASLVGSDLRGAMFMASNFSGADFSLAPLRGAGRQGGIFRGGVFAGASMVAL